jgi:tetratricopeptide (TPR) repeat protein
MAALAAYHNSFDGPFVFDDVAAVRDNPTIRRLWPIENALWAPADTTAAGRPLVNLSLAFNYALGGFDVRGYHAFNLAVHTLAALALGGIVRRTVRGPRANAIAWFTALLWLVHPLQTSTVTYIVQRAEAMMGLFYFLTLYCAIRDWNTGAIVACALGMATKETMVTAPAIVMLYDSVFRDRRRWGLYAGLAATWLILAALVGTGARAQSVGIGLANVGVGDYARTQCAVVLHYARLMIWPAPLVFDYYWPVAQTMRQWLPAAVVAAGLIGATVYGVRHRHWLGFVGGWCFVILAPSSSVIPIVTEIAAEHRTYLAVAGVIAAAVVAVASAGRAVLWIAGGVAALGLVGLTIQRNEVYRSEITLWTDTTAKRPLNPRAHNNLGNALLSAGRTDDALASFHEALRLEPGFAMAHNNLGNALTRAGRMDEALPHLHEALRLNPGYTDARINLGIALASRGEIEEATEIFREAVRRDTGSANARFNLGVALARQGTLPEALSAFDAALQIDPDFEPARAAAQDLRQRIGPHQPHVR